MASLSFLSCPALFLSLWVVVLLISPSHSLTPIKTTATKNDTGSAVVYSNGTRPTSPTPSVVTSNGTPATSPTPSVLISNGTRPTSPTPSVLISNGTPATSPTPSVLISNGTRPTSPTPSVLISNGTPATGAVPYITPINSTTSDGTPTTSTVPYITPTNTTNSSSDGTTTSVYPSIEPSPSNFVPPPPTKRSRKIVIILASVLPVAMIAAFFILIRVRYIRKQRSKEEEGRGSNADHEEWENSLLQATNLPKRFTYPDLKSATDNFHKKLGGGGFGSVFEGSLRDGTKVAVKRLDRFGQGQKEFLAEVKTIGSIHHISLVRLAGFCAEKSHKLLVYEYMSNGSLDKWIFNKNSESTLEWKIRKKIILNIAKGLAYLHEDCKMRIAHLDIKPQNILLDCKFDAKLSDFGLARLIDRNQSQVITQMRGTRGYMAPEWLSRKITEKVDVYSFGIVILEIICGRKNLDLSQPEEDDYLLLPIVKQKAEENQLTELVDKCTNMQQFIEEAVEMIRIAILCLHNDPTKRPSMSNVVKILEGVKTVEAVSDYGFLTYTVVEAPPKVVMVPSEPQSASILSGPR